MCRTFCNRKLAVLLILGGLVLLPVTSGQAASLKEPPGPDRITAITVNSTAYTWWMASWSKNQVVCSIVIDHDGEPTLGEVYMNCDPDIYYTWKDQPPCLGTGKPHSECKGYTHLKEVSRDVLRQSLVRSVNAACSNCPLGIDMSQASFSVGIFAHTLRGRVVWGWQSIKREELKTNLAGMQ